MELITKRGKGLKPWQKGLLFVLGTLLVIVLGLVIFVNAYISRALPSIEGTIQLDGLYAPVEVIRDGSGVPHIKAENEHDLFLAQGYVTAQERMFQMELSKRLASGRLSEVVGKDALYSDRYFRTLGLRRAAEKSYAIYSEDAKQILQWYADGVNAYLKDARSNHEMPVEFFLMGIEPEPWTPIDSLTIGKYMAFDLGGHWERQAFHYYLLHHFPEEKAYELFPEYPDEVPTIIREEAYVDVQESFSEAILPNPFNGSNNWVVDGSKTRSGKPILANDPHLGLGTPSIWFQTHLEAPDYNVSGVIFAGVPGIIVGHNEHIAWGVTNVGPDVQQLYIEKRHPEDPHQFLFEDQWEQANVIEETIEVKDGEPVTLEVVETRHGPVISEFAKESGDDTVLSLRWTALDPTTELEAILEINRAKSWETFEKGLEKFLVPAQNFVFASKDGTIAYKANGRIPVYPRGKNALLPLEGWIQENEWQGFIPFDELPRVVNPEKGYIATANNKIAPENYPYHISHVWAQPYRYMRIEEVLSEKSDLTVEDMQTLQMDQMNLQAKEFVPLYLDALKGIHLSLSEQEVLKVLSSWNFRDDQNLAAPLIFHKWKKEIESVIYEDIPEEMMEFFKAKGQTTDELMRKAFRGETVAWIEEKGGIQSVLRTSLSKAVKQLRKEHGTEVLNWKWGDAHRVSFVHPLSSVKVLSYFFNPEDPLPVGGSGVTVMAAKKGTDGMVDHGAPWRFVADLSDLSQAWHMVAPGQSGHFKSQWYDDQMDDWVNGDYHVTKLKEMEGKTLYLIPEG
ncbi:penicillin amidase [Melghiribacillus thermohalophilus]|uniref:Penicillin amidase n=1 Tax=Melghiribacillus thermohalophilus TaxID=1324956 RepID=A0A4R3MU57_9BACI|nr:penicillin acylase family protein [Melghiribacillus thermohalophilus]TCT20000.1 penicillin amidase [Melghiribacillus thermohalophilus]